MTKLKQYSIQGFFLRKMFGIGIGSLHLKKNLLNYKQRVLTFSVPRAPLFLQSFAIL